MIRVTLAILFANASIGGVGYLLYPIASSEHAIVFDTEAVARKQVFLEGITPTAEPERPNILILLADDLGKMDCSIYGGTRLETPNIDALAERGALFTQAYATSPTCSPSRAAMLTGRYQQRFGYETQIMTRYPRNRLEHYGAQQFIDWGNWRMVDDPTFPRQEDIERQGLPPSEITLGALLGAHSYDTGYIGKWHLGETEHFHPHRRGFDYEYGFYEAFTLYAPEGAQDLAEFRLDMYEDRHMWTQARTGACAIRRNGEVVEDHGYLTFSLANECMNYMEQHQDDPFALVVAFNAPHAPFQAPRDYYDKFAHIEDHGERIYAAMIAALDDAVGQIAAKTEALGIADNTMIWFASDNGAATYTGVSDNAPLKGGKFTYFEGGVNVPMSLTWPARIEAGAVCHEPVSLMDVFTTSAAAAGAALPVDRRYDGVDLIPLLAGEDATLPRDALYWRAHHALAVRQGDWKLIRDEEFGRELLYNLVDDKYESADLAAEHPARTRQLGSRLSAWAEPLAPPRWPRLMDYRFEFDGVDFYAPI